MPNNRFRPAARLGSILMGAALLTACQTTSQEHQQSFVDLQDSKDSYAFVTLPNAGRTVVVSSKDSDEVLCLVPTADFAEANSLGVSIAPGKGISEGQSDLGLGGRSSSVLITREILYRSCEFITRYTDSNDEAKEIFFRTLDIVQDIAKNDRVVGTASASAVAAAPALASASGDADGSDDSSDLDSSDDSDSMDFGNTDDMTDDVSDDADDSTDDADEMADDTDDADNDDEDSPDEAATEDGSS